MLLADAQHYHLKRKIDAVMQIQDLHWALGGSGSRGKHPINWTDKDCMAKTGKKSIDQTRRKSITNG